MARRRPVGEQHCDVADLLVPVHNRPPARGAASRAYCGAHGSQKKREYEEDGPQRGLI
jgi:hypothetical protein